MADCTISGLGLALGQAETSGEEQMPTKGIFTMKISLTPVTLSPAELKVVATAARLQGATIGQFIARTSLDEALQTLQRPPRDLKVSKRIYSRPLTSRSLPPKP